MKHYKLLTPFFSIILALTFTSCGDDSLNALERDIIGEWVVDDYILSGDNIAEDGTVQDMHFIFENNFDVEVSWFENGDFFVVDGSWQAFEDSSTIEIDLDDKVFFFCNDDDIEFNIFFFAGDMELDTSCSNSDWMEIQLERF